MKKAKKKKPKYSKDVKNLVIARLKELPDKFRISIG